MEAQSPDTEKEGSEGMKIRGGKETEGMKWGMGVGVGWPARWVSEGWARIVTSSSFS